MAQVPRAGGRWKQVHFNIDVGRQFFRAEPGSNISITLERVDSGRNVAHRVSRPNVFPDSNRNYRVEFDFGSVRNYPASGRPILVILELDLRYFRYAALMPGDAGHNEMLNLTTSLTSLGSGVPRVLTTLDEVELRWPGCYLR